MPFTYNNLMHFETLFFGSNYFENQRYGQSFMNYFELDTTQLALANDANMFYEKDTETAKCIAWQIVETKKEM